MTENSEGHLSFWWIIIGTPDHLVQKHKHFHLMKLMDRSALVQLNQWCRQSSFHKISSSCSSFRESFWLLITLFGEKFPDFKMLVELRLVIPIQCCIGFSWSGGLILPIYIKTLKHLIMHKGRIININLLCFLLADFGEGLMKKNCHKIPCKYL